MVYPLVEGPARFWSPLLGLTGALGVACLVAFVVVERRCEAPMRPLLLFRSRQVDSAGPS